MSDADLAYLTTMMGLQRYYWFLWVLFATLAFICAARETIQEAGMWFLLMESGAIEGTFCSPFSSTFGGFEGLECDSGDSVSS
jgi:hypothetical protein